MIKSLSLSQILLLLMSFTYTISCNAQAPPDSPEDIPIADYVVEAFGDSKGTLWFGTMSKGVARFDGNHLTYITTTEGIAGNTVASIAEDRMGNLWFSTHTGLSSFDGETF